MVASLDLLPKVREHGRVKEAASKQSAAKRYNSNIIRREMMERELVLKKRTAIQHTKKLKQN